MTNLGEVYKECAKGHPHITNDPAVFGGAPYERGTQVKVSELLARLYALGSIPALIHYYNDLDEEQTRDEIYYALRFMELICEPQPPALPQQQNLTS